MIYNKKKITLYALILWAAIMYSLQFQVMPMWLRHRNERFHFLLLIAQ